MTSSIYFSKLFKNKYLIPVFIVIIVAISGTLGFLIGRLTVREKTRDLTIKSIDIKTGEATVEIKKEEKKDLKKLLFGSKEYNLIYADMDTLLVENISFFESDEGWQGDGFLDWRYFHEGEMSMAVTSKNHGPGIIFLEKDLNLSNLKTVEFFISLNDLQPFELATIKFGDSSLTNYYSYSLSNLHLNWNFIRIPQNQFVARKVSKEFTWKDIKKIQFEIISRPNTTTVVNLDYLTIQKKIDYLDKWKTVDSNFLSLGKKDDKIILIARNNTEATYLATLDGIIGDNFTYQASFIPQIMGTVGLFFRGDYRDGKGYYLLVGGLGTNSIILTKKVDVNRWKDLTKVVLSGFVFEKDQKYWLKVETKGKRIIGFISITGKDFIKLFSVIVDELTNGEVGIAVFNGGYAFFDDFKFKQ
ncbi:MAG: hypothetical protein V1872_10885 [bacterium]